MSETDTPLPIRSRLDIVQDCSDLRGTFPENVELRFVYWNHGESTGGLSAPEDAQKLAPYCQDADVIAIEIALTVQAQPSDVLQEYGIINNYLQEWVKRQGNPELSTTPQPQPEELYGSLPVSDSWEKCIHLFRAIVGAAKEPPKKPPEFMPVDVMEHDEGGNWMSAVLKLEEWPGFDTFTTKLAESNRHREAVVLRQLHAKANELAADGKEHQIVIIYGIGHLNASVGARELGANMSRVYVDQKRTMDLLTHAVKLKRYDVDNQLPPEEIEAIERQGALGFAIVELAQEFGLEIPDTKDVEDRLFILNMRVDQNTLARSDLKAYSEAMAVVKPLLDQPAEKIPRRRQKSYRQALQKLVELSINPV